MKQIPNVPYPEDLTPQFDPVHWLITPHAILCPQCHTFVQREDFDPRAGTCGACINEAMAEAPEYFGQRGLVSSVEEQEAHD